MHGHRSYAPCGTVPALPMLYLCLNPLPSLATPPASLSTSLHAHHSYAPCAALPALSLSVSASLCLLLASTLPHPLLLLFPLSLPPSLLLFIFVSFAVVGNSKSSVAAAIALPQQMATAALDQAAFFSSLSLSPPSPALSPLQRIPLAKQNNQIQRAVNAVKQAAMFAPRLPNCAYPVLQLCLAPSAPCLSLPPPLLQLHQ